MRSEPLPLRARADATGIFRHYATEAGPAVAVRFLSALDEALRFIREFPGAGSPRYAKDTGHPDLRVWRLKKFPILLFYRQTVTGVEVLRILHAARGMPASLREPPDA
jgi:toxin ParE1/3/4